ncbi:MAG: PepSY-associated TM helix domain-containing protein [Oxalicibacterium faecigallinarum]|uniref:PepSY-associated TM helix domain-containing protein n=1 Tax=Oxalicibacterium faecigallinarum TaxID=573741 RepID=UPI0028089D65|nr:PepSY-associated TM helix domain-containing protein [Oxalicibacterium faecigallinarum]MDQ7970267.1 PepSY-associated TM helix domain-containing protein [Oxalicibacterium faecigallinarum]
MAWLHTWTGLVVGWVLFFVFITGTVGYGTSEIDRWMRPELPLVTAADVDVQDVLSKAEAHLQKNAADATGWSIVFPGTRGQPNIGLFWRTQTEKGARFERATLDRESGEAMPRNAARATGGGRLLYRMHYSLHYIPYDWAFRLIGVCTMLMFLAIVSGVITHKKIFADFFTFRPAKGQRSWLDAHNLISVMALPFFVMITYSGLLFFMFQYMPLSVAGVYGAGEDNAKAFYDQLDPRFARQEMGERTLIAQVPLLPMVQEAEREWGKGNVRYMEIEFPNRTGSTVKLIQKTETAVGESPEMKFDGATGKRMDEPAKSNAKTFRDVMYGLHEGTFAGPLLRWLYLISGALGAAMIATGLVLWTVKRRVKQDKRLKAGEKTEFGFRLVECLNIGTVAGLPLGLAAYFWANRLIPAQMDGRAAWEVHAMFALWGLSIVYAACRPSLKAWHEVLWAAATAFLLLPVLNALTSDRHLGITLRAGDWQLASVDLCMLATGVFFVLAASKVRRKLTAPAPPSARAAASRRTGSTESVPSQN